MELLTHTLLVIHVIAGFTTFFTGPIAIFTPKFKRSHHVTGKIFSYAMLLVFLTAIYLSVYRSSPFLFMVGIFSFYSVVSGVRVIYLHRAKNDYQLKWWDWTIHGVFLITNLCFIGYGAYVTINYGFQTLAILSFLFGFGGLQSIVGNVKPFIKRKPGFSWMRYHLNNMMGAYIASVTAFSAQQLDFMPALLQWTWPTIVIAPLIAYYSRKVRLSII